MDASLLLLLFGGFLVLVTAALRVTRRGAGGVRPLDGFAALAFGLAVFIMVLPTEADILFSLLAHDRRVGLALLVALACFAVVFIPCLASWRRQWRQPGVWRGRGYLIAATVILAINLLMCGAVFVRELFR